MFPSELLADSDPASFGRFAGRGRKARPSEQGLGPIGSEDNLFIVLSASAGSESERPRRRILPSLGGSLRKIHFTR
jgi:hypothetical protein